MSDPTPQPPADQDPAVPPIPPAPPYATPTEGSYYAQPPAAPPSPAPASYPPAYQNPPAYQAPAPYPTPTAYPQQYGYAAPQTNSLAVVSLVAGIAAFVILPVIAAIVAVITGHMALTQLKTSGESGRGLALTGTILGWVGIGVGVIIVIFVIFWFVVVFGAIASSTYSYS